MDHVTNHYTGFPGVRGEISESSFWSTMIGLGPKYTRFFLSMGQPDPSGHQGRDYRVPRNRTTGTKATFGYDSTH